MNEDEKFLLQRFLDEQADPEELAALGRALAANPEVAAELVRLAALEDHLQTYFTELRHDDFRDRMDQAPHDRSPTVVKSPSTWSGPWSLRSPRFVSVVAVLTLMIWGGLFLFLASSQNPPSPPNVALSPAPTPMPVVARLMYGDPVVWENSSASPAEGSFLRQGDEVALKHGWIDLHLNNGVRISLEGPAKLALSSLEAGRLDYGRLLAEVPPAAHGFTVHTRLADVVDRGTEFGVETEAAKLRVTVFQGRVETYLKGQTKPQPLVAGESWSLDAAGPRTLAAPPSALSEFRELRQSMQAPAGVRFRVFTLPPSAGDDSVVTFGDFEAGLNAGPLTTDLVINGLRFENAAAAASRSGVTIRTNAQKVGIQDAAASVRSWRENLAQMMRSWDASHFSQAFQVVVGGLEVGRTYHVVFYCAQPLDNTGFRVMHVASGKDQSARFDASGARGDLCPVYVVAARFTATQPEQEFTLQGAQHSRSVLGGVAVFSQPKSP